MRKYYFIIWRLGKALYMKLRKTIFLKMGNIKMGGDGRSFDVGKY